MGVQVDVFTRSQDEHVPHVLHDLGYGNRVVHVRAGPEVPLPKSELATFIPDFVNGIQEFTGHKGITYDLIHSHYWMSGLAAKDLKAAWGLPVVHMFHTLGLMKQRVARDENEREGEYRIHGEREVLRLSDRVIAATPAELAQLQWLYQADSKKIVVIPPGVDISHFYPISPDEAKEFIGVPPCEQMLLFVGRIERLKGIDTLIDAISILYKDGLIVCLSVIGGDSSLDPEAMSTEMARLQTLREEHGLKDLITFLGSRSQDSLPYYYSAAEAVVVPSHYESFGLVALEAMACGTPVVASQVGGLAFLIRDGVTGFTVPADEPQSLADCLRRLVTDPALRLQMGENAANFAREYRWQNIAEKVLNLYQQVVGEHLLAD
jgi:D-inositol-3-phosphate glycosyltransferase